MSPSSTCTCTVCSSDEDRPDPLEKRDSKEDDTEAKEDFAEGDAEFVDDDGESVAGEAGFVDDDEEPVEDADRFVDDEVGFPEADRFADEDGFADAREFEESPGPPPGIADDSMDVFAEEDDAFPEGLRRISISPMIFFSINEKGGILTLSIQ